MSRALKACILGLAAAAVWGDFIDEALFADDECQAGAEECGLEALQLRSRKLHDAAVDGADGAAKEALWPWESAPTTRPPYFGGSGYGGGSTGYGAPTTKPPYFGGSGYGGGSSGYGAPTTKPPYFGGSGYGGGSSGYGAPTTKPPYFVGSGYGGGSSGYGAPTTMPPYGGGSGGYGGNGGSSAYGAPTTKPPYGGGSGGYGGSGGSSYGDSAPGYVARTLVMNEGTQIGARSVLSAAGCAQECNNMPGCQSFTFGFAGSDFGKCFLKDKCINTYDPDAQWKKDTFKTYYKPGCDQSHGSGSYSGGGSSYGR